MYTLFLAYCCILNTKKSILIYLQTHRHTNEKAHSPTLTEIHTHTNISTYTQTYIYSLTFKYTPYTKIINHINTHKQTGKHKHKHTHTHSYTHTHTHSHSHTHTHTHTHIHTHTQSIHKQLKTQTRNEPNIQP